MKDKEEITFDFPYLSSRSMPYDRYHPWSSLENKDRDTCRELTQWSRHWFWSIQDMFALAVTYSCEKGLARMYVPRIRWNMPDSEVAIIRLSDEMDKHTVQTRRREGELRGTTREEWLNYCAHRINAAAPIYPLLKRKVDEMKARSRV